MAADCPSHGESIDELECALNENCNTTTRFCFSHIDIRSVLSTLKSLNVSKSTGIDNLPAKILKLSADLIAPSLTYIFNLSLECGEFVDEWKKARVTPIYKSGDKTKCENYRPISILPIISKVFEKEVFRQVYSYLTDHCLLSKYQSGFRPKHSTLSALIQICDDLLNNMDQGKISCIVFLDIRKAFDSINHDILLQKMNDKFGFSYNELKWFKSYLNNREQQCFVNGQMSSPRRIMCGVPQGSILSPLLFLLYINDLPECLNNTVPSLYADDTEIYASSNDSVDLINKLNPDLNNVSNWMDENKLRIHPKKSKHMFVGSNYNIKNKVCNLPISINNVSVPRVSNQKCLGVILDEKLSWENHIDMICKKVGAGIAVIKRVKPFIPKENLQALYNAIVQPYFDYCCPLWDNCGKVLKEKLQKYQSRAARVITGATFDIRTADVFLTLGWENLDTRRDYLKSIFIYKILNNLTTPNLNGLFTRTSDRSIPYSLRQSDTNLVLPIPKSEFKKRSFQYSASHHWNALPYQAKKAKTITSFKKAISSN